MNLTAEQRADIERQRQEAPARHSFRITLTPDQRREYRQAVADELAGREQNLERVRQLESAESEPTLCGALRRAISDSRRPPQNLADELGIDSRRLSDFRAGRASLPSDVIERLIAILDLEVIVTDVGAP